MFIVDILFWVLFSCLLYFLLYNFVIIFKSSSGRLKDVEKKDYLSRYQQDLTFVIYSHNDSHLVKSLINQINDQDYSADRYSINVIMDNCDEANCKLLEIFGNAKLWRINSDSKPIGKYKSLAWLFERILSCDNTNAFIFLTADSKIKKDFLQKANTAVYYYPVVVGDATKRKNNFYNRLLNFKNKLKNKVIGHGRFYCGLGNLINSDILAIRQDVLEKVKFTSTDYGFDEYEYSVKLKSNNIPVYYSSELTCVKSGYENLSSLAKNEFKKRYKSLITFRNNFPNLFTNKSIGLKEFIFSFCYPSNTTFIMITAILGCVLIFCPATVFSAKILPKYLLYTVLAKFAADLYSLLSIRAGFKDYKNAIASFFNTPIIYFYSLINMFMINIKLPSLPKISLNKAKADSLQYEKYVVDATITNGKKELPCSLEIRTTDKYAQVIFNFKNKKLYSSKQPRVNYAVEEIIKKLKNQGFALKICMNCGFFYMTESAISHYNGEKGLCLYNNFHNQSKGREFTCVWDGCYNIIPSQARNYICSQLNIDVSKSRI